MRDFSPANVRALNEAPNPDDLAGIEVLDASAILGADLDSVVLEISPALRAKAV
jgi:hypothetical protein